MSVAAIRKRAARFTNLRRAVFLLGLVLMLGEAVIFGRIAPVLPGTVTQIGMLTVLVGLGWMIARVSLLAPRRLPDAKASGESILEYHRAELQRGGETFRDLLVMAGPALLGCAVVVVGLMIARPRATLQAAPLLALLGLWVVGAWWMAKRAQRVRQRKLAEIEATRVEPD